MSTKSYLSYESICALYGLYTNHLDTLDPDDFVTQELERRGLIHITKSGTIMITDEGYRTLQVIIEYNQHN